jgi:ribosomal protein L20A (L18A)
MKSYRISFFNELRNDTGHMFHCCQRVVEIRLARSKERAIEAAKRRFARREQISNWSIHARSIEIEEIEKVDVPPEPR